MANSFLHGYKPHEEVQSVWEVKARYFENFYHKHCTRKRSAGLNVHQLIKKQQFPKTNIPTHCKKQLRPHHQDTDPETEGFKHSTVATTQVLLTGSFFERITDSVLESKGKLEKVCVFAGPSTQLKIRLPKQRCSFSALGIGNSLALCNISNSTVTHHHLALLGRTAIPDGVKSKIFFLHFTLGNHSS